VKIACKARPLEQVTLMIAESFDPRLGGSRFFVRGLDALQVRFRNSATGSSTNLAPISNRRVRQRCFHPAEYVFERLP
jgi:hypothetical protein